MTVPEMRVNEIRPQAPGCRLRRQVLTQDEATSSPIKVFLINHFKRSPHDIQLRLTCEKSLQTERIECPPQLLSCHYGRNVKSS